MPRNCTTIAFEGGRYERFRNSRRIYFKASRSGQLELHPKFFKRVLLHGANLNDVKLVDLKKKECRTTYNNWRLYMLLYCLKCSEYACSSEIVEMLFDIYQEDA